MRNIKLVLLVYAIVLISTTSSYDTPSNPQYHIQTDEGPERYFRYQTLSGQFRKEKRLEDGTVIGTYAWIDDDGILRQRDYIADHAGYRITKSKNLYVGRNIPVADAIKAAKKYPASAGTSVSAKARPVPVRPSISTVAYSQLPHGIVSSTPLPPLSSTTPCASCVVSSTTYKPEVEHFGPSTIGHHVEIANNALPASVSVISTTQRPYVEINPGGVSGLLGSTTIAPQVASSTGLPLEYLKTNVQAINNLQYHGTSTPGYTGYDGLPSYAEADQNSLEFNPYVSPSGENVFFQNGPTYPIDRNGHTYRGTKKYTQARIGNGYDKQFPEYDGVSVTNDGFRYYIPRAYHEEDIGPGDEKTGSFGYIDPFGIRRVIYYNAKPGQGFQHRKNNRYVGFHATPYDPNPY